MEQIQPRNTVKFLSKTSDLKKKKNKEYLETAAQYHAEEIKNLNNIENEEKRNLFIETRDANKGK